MGLKLSLPTVRQGKIGLTFLLKMLKKIILEIHI